MKPLTITCTLRFLALLAGLVMDASACSCATVGSNPPCQAAWGVAAVFTGTVVEITEPSLVVPPQTGASTSGRQTVNDPRQPQLPWPKRIIRMKLGEAFTGVDPPRRKSKSPRAGAAAIADIRSRPAWIMLSTRTG